MQFNMLDATRLSGGLTSKGSVLSLNPSKDHDESRMQHSAQQERQAIDDYKGDFGSGHGVSIIPGAGIIPSRRPNDGSAVLQAQTRERDNDAELHGSSSGNVVRTVSAPARGSSPHKLRLQKAVEHHVNAPPINAAHAAALASHSERDQNPAKQHAKEELKSKQGGIEPRSSRVVSGGDGPAAGDASSTPARRSKEHPAKPMTTPEWVRQSTDPVTAGLGSGPPTWVSYMIGATGTSTPTNYNKFPKPDKKKHGAITGLPYDDASTVTASPQSIADDSLAATPPAVGGRGKRADNARSAGLSTRRLLGLKKSTSSPRAGDGIEHQPPRSKSSERVHFSLPGNKEPVPMPGLRGSRAMDTIGNSVSSVGDLVAEKRVRDANKIALWLESLNIRFDNKEEFVTAYAKNSNLTEFSNGVLLGQLACKLERLVEIPGFTPHPKSPAQGLQNIRRVLEVFSKNNRIKVSLLSNAEEIHEGNGVAIMDLLTTLRKVYAHIVS
jgi:hypothetical protein